MKYLPLLAFLALNTAAAQAACEAPVAFGSPKFAEQIRKAEYTVIYAGEVISTPAADQAGEASANVSSIIITKDNSPDLLPKGVGPVVMKMRKAKGVRLDKGKPFVIFVNKDKDGYLMKECNHSYPAKGVLFTNIPKDVAAIKAAYPEVSLPPPGPAAPLAASPNVIKGPLPPPGPAPKLKASPPPGTEVKAPEKVPEKLPPPGTPPPLAKSGSPAKPVPGPKGPAPKPTDAPAPKPTDAPTPVSPQPSAAPAKP